MTLISHRRSKDYPAGWGEGVVSHGTLAIASARGAFDRKERFHVFVNGARPRVLVIENDTWVRTDRVGQLATAGYEVRDASNGLSGLRLARGAVPDVIVLGAELPDLPAVDVREQLNHHRGTRGIPVIPLIVAVGGDSDSVAVKVQEVLDGWIP